MTVFDRIVRHDGDRIEELSIDDFRAIPLSERCLLLVQGRIEFRQGEVAVPTKQALREIARQRSTIPPPSFHEN